MSVHAATLACVLAFISSSWPGVYSSASECLSHQDLANIPKLFLVFVSNFCFSSGQSKVGFGFGLPQVLKAPVGCKDAYHRLYLCTVVQKHKVTMTVV